MEASRLSRAAQPSLAIAIVREDALAVRRSFACATSARAAAARAHSSPHRGDSQFLSFRMPCTVGFFQPWAR